jgi:hypothetical protein
MKCKSQTGRAALLRGLGFWRRGSAALPLLAAMVLFLAAGAAAGTKNVLSDAEIQGSQLAQQLCDAQPAENFTNTGVLKIRDSSGMTTNFPVRFQIVVGATNWQAIYTASFVHHDNTNNYGWQGDTITIVHASSQPNQYKNRSGFFYGNKFRGEIITMGPVGSIKQFLSDKEIITPFAKSDFWIGDLGLEFFHWPAQKVLPKPTNLVRGRDYTLLESTNPSTNGYSRVLSWIDKETGGILQAEAYDFNGKLLKEFSPKSFKKVNGQWELQEMEIRNVQTGSRTRLEFDLNKQ